MTLHLSLIAGLSGNAIRGNLDADAALKLLKHTRIGWKTFSLEIRTLAAILDGRSYNWPL